MRKTVIVLVTLLIATALLCGCAPKETSNTLSNHTCITCGRKATHYMGKQVIDKTYRPVELYYCDACYNEVIEDAEENNRIVHDTWWE